jgi:hypothetical protein
MFEFDTKVKCTEYFFKAKVNLYTTLIWFYVCKLRLNLIHQIDPVAPNVGRQHEAGQGGAAADVDDRYIFLEIRGRSDEENFRRFFKLWGKLYSFHILF